MFASVISKKKSFSKKKEIKYLYDSILFLHLVSKEIPFMDQYFYDLPKNVVPH